MPQIQGFQTQVSEWHQCFWSDVKESFPQQKIIRFNDPDTNFTFQGGLAMLAHPCYTRNVLQNDELRQHKCNYFTGLFIEQKAV